MKYFLSIKNEQLGPFTEEMLIKIIKSGKVEGDEYIWYKEENKWIKLKQHPEFSQYFAGEDSEEDEQYLLKYDGKVLGPLSIDKMRDRILNGKLKKDDSVWSVKKGKWVKASEVENLKEIFKIVAEEEYTEDYYISIDGNRMGPFNVEKIKQMIREGIVSEESYFYNGEKWIKITTIDEFKEVFQKDEIPEPDFPPEPVIDDLPVDEDISEPPPAPKDDTKIEPPPPPSGDKEPQFDIETPGDDYFTEDISDGDEKDFEEEIKDEGIEKHIEKTKKKPWLDDVIIHKVDLTGMDSSSAYSIPTSLMDENSINYSLPLYNKVTRGKRFIAALIDGFITIIFFLLVLIGLRVFDINPLIEGPEQYNAQITLISIFGGLSLFYLLFRDGFTKFGSFGKKFANIMLINKKNRRPCGVFRSFARNITLLIPLINFIEILVILFSSKGTRIGDKIAGTELIEVPLEDKPF
jgi:uncharacterized RDD family membrane protein YckC